MTRRFALFALPFLGMALLAASFATAAEDYFKLVPDSAWGVVAINNPKELDEKLQALGGETQLPIPGLLEMLKQDSDVQDGLDEKAALAAMVLPPLNAGAPPTPILMIPVADYAKFLAQLSPESTTAEVTKVTLAGRSFYIRHLGGFAVLAGPSFRNALDSLKIAAETPAAMKPWREWFSSRDAAVVIFQPGIKDLCAKAQIGLNAAKAMVGGLGDQGKQAVAGLEMYAKFFQAVEKEVNTFGLGLLSNEKKAILVTTRTELVPTGNWSKSLANATPAKDSLVKGLPGDPFVAAGGVAVSDALMESMMKLSLNFMKTMPDIYGLSEQQIGKLSELMGSKFKGVRSMSMALGVGKSNDPIYANLRGVMMVESSKSYMDDCEKYFQSFDDIVKDSKSSMLPKMEIEKCEVAGLPALHVTMNIPKPQGIPQPPQYDKMMEAMLGPGEKLDFWMAPADEHTIVVGYVNKEPLEQLIAAVKKNESGLEKDAEVLKTAALLPNDAPAVGYLSPQGMISLVQRILPAVAPPQMPMNFNIPDFPQTPPIGFAVKTAPNALETTMAVPDEVLAAIGKYVQHIRGMTGEGVAVNP